MEKFRDSDGNTKKSAPVGALLGCVLPSIQEVNTKSCSDFVLDVIRIYSQV